MAVELDSRAVERVNYTTVKAQIVACNCTWNETYLDGLGSCQKADVKVKNRSHNSGAPCSIIPSYLGMSDKASL